MSAPRTRCRRPRRPEPGGELPPDILYHATSLSRAERARGLGVLEVAREHPVFLSDTEEAAWRVAHRQSDHPWVLFVDAARARRDGLRFERVRPGLWQVGPVPARHVLNLHPGFAEQASAGGFLLWEGEQGPELALIKVGRRVGSTWEVAKGKIETCETPLQTCLREMCEEMGLPLERAAEMELVGSLGVVRYGFQTPSGDPRLKTLFLYLIRTRERWVDFTPSAGESILEVAWFSPREAARLVHHRSLRPLMDELCRRLDSRPHPVERS